MRGAGSFKIFSLLLSLTDAFKIVSISQNEKVHQPGEPVTLLCKSDDYWEYCTWTHKKRECSLEWKYKKGGVIKQNCHDELDPRTTYSGDYEKHECSITISSVQLRDAGSWSCEMESYVWGSTRGYKSKSKIEVVIEEKSTTTKATTTATGATESSTTAESSTTTASRSTTEEIKLLPDTDYTANDEEESQYKHDDTDSDDSVYEYNDEVVTALPVSDLESAPSQTSAGLIAGVIVCLAAMGLVVAGVGVTYYRRRKSHQAIISYLQAERDDAMASNAFLEEAEYHISIIRDPQSLPLSTQASLKTSRPSDILDNSVTEVLTVSDTKES